MGERKDQTDCHTFSFRSETVCTQAYCMILWFGAVEFAGHVAELTRPFLHSHTHICARVLSHEAQHAYQRQFMLEGFGKQLLLRLFSWIN